MANAQQSFRLRDHFTREQWLEMLGAQRAAECQARRMHVQYTECTQVYGSRALVPLYAQMGEQTRAKEIQA